MAEEAAQAAAMRAYEEALRETQHQDVQQGQQLAGGFGFDPAMLLESGNMMHMDGFPAGDVEEDQNQQQQLQQQDQQQRNMLQELMGMPGANLDDAATAHQLLQVLEQQRQQQATLAAAEEAQQQRPEQQQELTDVPETNLDDAAKAHLMQALEQQRQQQATLAAAEEALQRKPEKHYLAISQDGKLTALFIFSIVFCMNTNEPTIQLVPRRRNDSRSYGNNNGLCSSSLAHDFCV